MPSETKYKIVQNDINYVDVDNDSEINDNDSLFSSEQEDIADEWNTKNILDQYELIELEKENVFDSVRDC